MGSPKNIKLLYLMPVIRHVHRHFGGQVLKPKKRAPIANLFMKYFFLQINNASLPASISLSLASLNMTNVSKQLDKALKSQILRVFCLFIFQPLFSSRAKGQVLEHHYGSICARACLSSPNFVLYSDRKHDQSPVQTRAPFVVRVEAKLINCQFSPLTLVR